MSEISGPVALEFGSQTYVTAMDNGLFTLGAPHNEGLHFILYLVSLVFIAFPLP